MQSSRSQGDFGDFLFLGGFVGPGNVIRRSFAVTLLWAFLVYPGITLGETYTDDLGRSIQIERPPQRIVSLAPGITEILFSLGLGDRVVGVTNYCDYPPAAVTKQRVGGLNPNFEVILTLRPDLVVGTAGLYQEENILKFKRFGIPFFIFDPTSLAKIFDMILVLGTMNGVEQAAKVEVRQLQERLDLLRQKIASFPRPRLLYVVDKEPLISVGKGSFLNDLIRDAGGISITQGLENAYPLVSIEYVIQQDPQVIILAMDADQVVTDQEKRYWSRWLALSAVREGRIYKVRRDLLNRPGPRVLDGLEELAGLLHPSLNRRGNR